MTAMDLERTQALVIGARRTGVAAARFLAARGAAVRLTDRATEGLDRERAALAGVEVEWRLGDESDDLLEGVALVVPSPGVARTSTLLEGAVRHGIAVVAEIELAARFLDVPIYAITGTNGKSTTTELLGEMLRRGGRRPFVGGNLGTPLLDAVGATVEGGPIDCAVVEVSSFQLEWVDAFHPTIGVFLNLTADHFDRYASLEEYGRTKARLFQRQTASDWAILSRDDPWVSALAGEVRSRVIDFGFGRTDADGAFPVDGTVVVRLRAAGRAETMLELSRTRLRGVHNLENVMAASTAALLAGVSPPAVQAAIDGFSGLPHRLQTIRTKDGVDWVDDSKGTNVGAVAKSLASVAAPVILLAGGVDKGGSYEPLRALVRERVKRLVLFGASRELIRSALGAETDTVLAGSLDEAVARAAEVARPGDTVLLSPACASFDMFRDYAERGERFRALVEAL